MYSMDEAEARINVAYCREIERIRVAMTAAKAARPDVNRCREHENGYIFFCTEDQDTEGGNDAVVFLKATGEVIGLSSCLSEMGNYIREWEC